MVINFPQELSLAYIVLLAFILSIILIPLFYSLALLARYFFRKYYVSDDYFRHVIYLVRLPKDKPADKEVEYKVQQLQEQIAVGETVFSTIGGLRAQRGLKAWFLGRNDVFSFEIVSNEKMISFYVSAPLHLARYLEQQIQAHYPEAVMEEVEDHNIFSKSGEILAGNLRPKRHYIFPLKTYKKMETDPLNSILNVMSKLEQDEGLAIQFIVRSAKAKWHRKAGQVVRKAYQTNSMKEALKMANLNPVTRFISEALKTKKKPKDPTKQNAYQPEMPKRLTAMEEEMLKGFEEKNSKAGLDVNIRIIANSNAKGKVHLYFDNLANVVSQYNYYEYGNSFRNKISQSNTKRTVKNYIYRKFNEKIRFILNTEELASMFHLPLKDAETPNINWLTAKHAPTPANLPNEGIMLGKNIYRGMLHPVHIKREDRRRHTYVIGKSGVGKSVLLANMAIQDIENGEGVCMLDPHGDLITDMLERIPPERAEDVILFAPADIERPLALNLLEYDQKYPEQKTFVINEMIKIFDKLYDLKSTGGPIFEQYMRNAMLLIMDSPETGSTLMEIPKVLADSAFRQKKLQLCKDHTVVDFWKKEAEKAGGDAALANVVPYITSKLTSFLSNDTMRPIIAQQKSSFSLREIMDNRKILLVDLSKGQVGEMNAHLLGLIIVGKILMSALSRTDIAQEERKDFYLYIDEFQNFATDSICTILSEARKYGLNLIMAHQYLGQLVGKNNDTTIKDAVFGNVGTWMLFKIGSEDAETMEKEFSPVFNQYDLINVEKGTAYVKLLVDNTASRPFSMKTIWPLIGTKTEGIDKKIKTLSRLKFGRDRNIIESEIIQRSKIA